MGKKETNKKKVWVVMQVVLLEDETGLVCNVCGVYSTREKAQEAALEAGDLTKWDYQRTPIEGPFIIDADVQMLGQ